MRKRLTLALAACAAVAAMLPGAASSDLPAVDLHVSCTQEGIGVFDEYSEKSMIQLSEFRRQCEAGTFKVQLLREDR